jgi:iron-sulfur cluster repair protein YtfE (RIC family)
MSKQPEAFPFQPDAVDVLIREHGTLNRLIHEAMPPASTASDLEKVAFDAEQPERLQSLQAEIEAHLSSEERVFYPFLLQFDEFRTQLTVCHEEHRKVRTELQILLQENLPMEGMRKALLALQSIMAQHIQFEERDIFPIFRNRVSRVDREGLATKLIQVRRTLKKVA